MYQIKYRFNITVSGVTRRVAPLYGNDLSLSFTKESEQQFFRRKLSGELTFINADYTYISSLPFDSRFELRMLISRDGGKTWTVYWIGYFYKTDCTFNADNQSVVVSPKSVDDYDNLLAGWEKEFNLMDLLLPMVPIEIVKRPMIQIYVPGDRVITNVLSSMSWESEIEPIENEGDLQSLYHFGLVEGSEVIVVSGAISPSGINGNFPSMQDMNGFYLYAHLEDVGEYDPDLGTVVHAEYVQDICRDGTVYWTYRSLTGYDYNDVTYTPISGRASGDLRIQRQSSSVYMRWVLDTPTAHNKTPYPIIASDPVYDNRNYHYVYPYVKVQRVIYFNNQFSPNPTKYGLYQPGQYYMPPNVSYGTPIPVGRSQWGATSIWYLPSQSLEWNEEQSLWQKYTMGNAYSIADVINKLLAEIAPGITHQATPDYSAFLYGTNPISDTGYNLCITPKSNVLKGSYSEPAQKAPITLKNVLDMLRDCFRCYCWIDENKRFRIEHISYFMRGGSYSENPPVGIDLTKATVKRTGKAWATAQLTYTFDKIEMPERYQFGWMDDVTQPFKGWPLDIENGYVEKGNIKEITVRNFTSDVDYMLLNPAGCSKDGFALFAATQTLVDNKYSLPFMIYYSENNVARSQNGALMFQELQKYYMYDMPAPNVKRNGVAMNVVSTKRAKRNTVKFPCLKDPNLQVLVKTFIGNGSFERLSVNLSSRNGEAILAYDTE